MRIWWVVSLAILMIGLSCSLGYPKEYLMGTITVDKMNSLLKATLKSEEIEVVWQINEGYR